MSIEKLNKSGTFLARVVDSGIFLTSEKKDAGGNVTKEGGKPMWTARLIVTKFYAESPEDLAFYKEQGAITNTEPQWVDWPEQEISPLMLLFNSSDDFSGDTAMKTYEQLVKATKWDGQEFATLDTAPIDDVILIRTEEETWQPAQGDARTEVKVQWVDHQDASPTRQLNKIDAEKAKTLGKIKMGGAKKAAPAPAAPAPAPAAPAPAAPAAPAPTPEPEAPAAPPATTPPPAPVEDPATEDAKKLDIPADLDKAKAWEFVTKHKGSNEDQVIIEAWTDAVGEVSEKNGNISDEDFNADQWAEVVKIIVRDCALAG